MNSSDIDLHPNDRKLRGFASIAGCLLAGMSAWRVAQGGTWIFFAPVAVLILAIGFVRPRLLRWFYVALAIAAFPIGWCVSRALLAIVFYGVFTPVALVFRLIGRDRLHRRRPFPQWRVKEISDEPAQYLHTF